MIFQMLVRLGGLLRGSRRLKRKRREQRQRTASALFPTLQVRQLEERRVFHAGAIAAPIAGATASQPPPPPAPTTTVTLDSGHNLLVQDGSATGQNDQLTIRLNATQGRYEIYDPAHRLATDIAGATGNGTNRVYVPIEAVTGSKLIFATGGGNDSLTVDLASGLGGKSLLYDGGAGDDSLTLVGGSYDAVSYVFSGDGTTQIQVGTASSTPFQLSGTESIVDQLAVGSRQFTLGSGLTGATLRDDSFASNQQSLLTTNLGTSVTFVSPTAQLTIESGAAAANQTLIAAGIDADFAADLKLDAGLTGHVEIVGNLNLQGHNLSAGGDTINVAGSVVTHAATIDLSARSSLTVTADGVFDNAAGRVLLDAGDAGTLAFSGRIDVSAPAAGGIGGTAQLLGREVKLLDQATIDASGRSGGGTVLVGGDYQGLNPLIRRATNTFVSADASITANALVQGNGGKIIVWADEQAIVAGSGNLHVRGGTQGGNGGLIETSGKRYLYVAGPADAGSPAGRAGTWLLDPHDVSIVLVSTEVLTAGSFTSSGGHTTIAAGTIKTALEAGTDVTINTGAGGSASNGDISVDAAITVSLGASTRTLTLNADRGIDVNQAITATSGKLNVVLNAHKTGTVGDVSIDATITTNGGNFASQGIQFDNTGFAINTGGGDLTLTHTGTVTIGGNLFVGAGTATIGVSGAGVAFTTGSISAQVVDINATGAITSDATGADITVSGAASSLTLSGSSLGSSTQSLQLNPGSAPVSLTAISGGIFVNLTSGDLNTSDFTLDSQGTGQTIRLTTTAGDINFSGVANFSNVADDNLDAQAGGSGHDITFSNDTTLQFNAVSLTANDDILNGSPTTTIANIDTSATDGAISLIAGGTIGSNSANVILAADAGLVAASTTSTTTTDGVFLTSLGALNLGTVSTGSAATQAVRVSTTGAGATLTVAAASSTDDNWTLNSSGGIAFGAAGSLTANSAALTASGAITGSSAATTDIDTNTANGSITLSGTSLGAFGTPLQLKPGTGSLSLTASSGGVFVNLDVGDLVTSRLTLNVQAAGQTIALSTTSGAVNFNSVANFSNTTNDDFQVTAAGSGNDISFTGNTNLVARSIAFSAADDILSGTASPELDTSSGSGAITLVAGGDIGASGNALILQAGGQISATSGGDIYVRQATGNLATSKFSVLNSTASPGFVSIGTLDGSVSVDSVSSLSIANDTLEIVAAGTGGNIAFGTSLIANRVQLNAAGNITSTPSSGNVDVNAAGGIDLVASGGIGASGDPLVVQAGTSLVAAKTSGSGAAGSIYLLSSGPINIGAVTTDGATTQTVSISNSGINSDLTISAAIATNDDWTLVATGNIAFGVSGSLAAKSANLSAGGAITGSSGPATDIDTSAANGAITLAGTSLGTSGTPLTVSYGAGSLRLTATTGGVFVNLDAGNLLTSKLTLDVQTADQTVSLSTSNGSVTFDSVAGFTNTTDDNWQVQTNGTAQDIGFSGATTLIAKTVSLTASGNIVSGSAASDLDTSALGGAVTLDANWNIGANGNELLVQAGGQIGATAGGNIYLRQPTGDLATSKFATLSSTAAPGIISIGTMDGSVTVDNAGGFSPSDDNLEIVARGTGGNISLNTTLAARSIRLDAVGTIQSGNTAPVDLDTSALGGNITLLASGPIGSSTTPIAVNTGAGNVAATTTAAGTNGNIYLTSSSSLNLGGIVTDTGSTQAVVINAASLTGAGVNLSIVAASVTNDDWTLTASGNIAFGPAGRLTANSAAMTAGGQITGSSAATTDIDTSAVNGPITLSGTSLGASGQPLQLRLGAGNLGLTATTGGVFVNLDAGDLKTSRVTLDVQAANQTIALSTSSGSVEFDKLSLFTNTTDDNFQVQTGGTDRDISFTGNTTPVESTLVARSVTLTASGNIVNNSPFTNIDTHAAGGAIDLSGDSLGAPFQSLQVWPGTGSLNLTATSGDIYVNVVSGSITAAQLRVSDAGTNKNIELSTTDGVIELDGDSFNANTANDNISINAGGNINFGDTPVIAASMRLVGSAIVGGTALSDVIVSGALEMFVGQGIGTAANPVAFSAATLRTFSNGDQFLMTAQTRVDFAIGNHINLVGGSFYVTNQIFAFSQLTVGQFAILGGNGSVLAPDIQVNGGINPGFGTSDAAILTLIGNVTVDQSATLFFDINSPYIIPGADYDQLLVTGGTLTLQTPTLQLNGGAQLQSSISGLTLVRGASPIVGEFAMGGSLTDDPQSPSPRVTLGNFRGHLLINAGSGNDIVIGELSLVPPIQRVGMRPPPPRIQVFTRVERPPTFVPPPPPMTPPVDPPIVEPEADVVVARYLEVRIVVPIDDAGNVREQMVMKLPAEWLERLPMILRRLPDDRYRIYLMLNGGEEERLVIDVFVRDGRPVEPTDTQADAAAVEGNLPQPEVHNPGADAPAPADGQPALSPVARNLDRPPLPPVPSRDSTGHWQPTTESAPGGRGNERLFVGAGVAAAGLIAGRKTEQWRHNVAKAAEAIGRQPRQKNWRWWRTHQPNGIPRS